MQTVIKHIFIFLLLISSRISFAQLTTNTGVNPQALVQNTLIGPGVTVSNITFNGSPSSIGSFSGTGTNLGIANGIVMTTGTVLTMVMAHMAQIIRRVLDNKIMEQDLLY